MLSRYGVFVCIIFLFSALTACDSVETEDMLTEQEVDALFTAIGTGFGLLEMENPVENPEPPVSDGMPPDENLEIAIDTVASCSGGGSIRAQGMSMTEISGEGGIADNIDLSLFPSECVMTVDDVTLRLPASPACACKAWFPLRRRRPTVRRVSSLRQSAPRQAWWIGKWAAGPVRAR